jgi:hypothetical protein
MDCVKDQTKGLLMECRRGELGRGNWKRRRVGMWGSSRRGPIYYERAFRRLIHN